MKCIYKYIFISFLLIILSFTGTNSIFAQKAIIVSNKVGSFIDSSEIFKYLLFTDYSFDEMIGAQVFTYNDEGNQLIIYLKNDRKIEKDIDKEFIKKIKNRINYFENEYLRGDTINSYSIFLNDGSIINGKIKAFTNDIINVDTEKLGKVKVATNDVVQIYSSISSEEKSIILGDNPHYSRYFFAPSAIPLDKGEGYFQDIYLLFISANYAISNHTTIGAGFSILPGVDINEQVFFINAKIAYPVTEKFYLGGGGLYFSIGDLGGNIGIGYAVGTYGSYDHNITLGVGYGFTDDELMDIPVFTVCAMTRVSKRISLMTENWFITASTEEELPPDFTNTKTVREFVSLVSYGLRFFGDKLSVDLAFMNVPTEGEFFFPGIPYIDFVVRF